MVLLTGNNARDTATRVSQEGLGQIKRGSRELYLLGSGSMALGNITCLFRVFLSEHASQGDY